MRIRMITAGFMGLATCSVAFAQGSFNFDDIPGIDQEPIVRVDINPTMIGFFKGMLEAADPNPDPGTPSLFAGLRGIKLRVYSATNNSDEFSEFIQDTALSLEGQGWQSVMSVQDAGSSVRIHLKMTEDVVSGMTIMAMDGTETILMNIDGSISAAELGRLMMQFDVPEVIAAMPAFPATSPPPQNDSAPVPDGN